MKHKILSLAALLVFCFSYASTLNAGLKDIKKRMQSRLPAIIKLKEAGLIGENNKGFLEARKKLTPAQKKIIDAENADRKTVYAMMAKQNGLSIEAVGKIRAKKIAETTAKGYWIQKPDGQWYQK